MIEVEDGTQVGTGPLFIIGGGEDRDPSGDRDILCELARRAPGDKIVIATCATRDPGEDFDRYRKAFRDLDVKQIVHLQIDHREDADDPAMLGAVAHNPRLSGWR